MRSNVARTWILIIVTALLSACGQSPSGSAATPSTSSGQSTAQTATSSDAPTAATSSDAPTAAAAAGTTSGDAIPIGLAVAQTSNVALFGQEQVAGAQAAEEYFNAKGGVNGRPIKLVLQDTGGDEAGTINAFNALINNDNVVGIVGPTLSQQAFAADPIADKAGIPVVGPSNTAGGIPQIGDYIARISAPVSVVAPNAIKAALAINPTIKKVVVLFAQNDAFSKSETVVFQKTVTDTFKLELAGVQTFQTTDTDFTSQATFVLNAAPDLTIISGLAADSGNLVKQLRDLGYTGLIVGGNGLNTPNLFPVCKAACDGILVAQAYSYQVDSPINQAFRETFKAKQQKEPGQFSGQAFTAVQVFVEALIALDKQTPIATTDLAQLRTALNKQILIGNYDTPLGQISFTPEGDINQKQFYIAQVKMDADGANGQFVFVK
ncbi:MAG: ABC transporter substrate-binding protein [Roseiflexaceae bacterium]